jgi:hypothetical protein
MPAMRIKVRSHDLAAVVFALGMILCNLSMCHRAQAQVDLMTPRSPIPLTSFGLHFHHLWRDPLHREWNEADWGWPLRLGRNLLYSWDYDNLDIAPNGHPNTPMVQTCATAAHGVAEPDGLWAENLSLPNGTQRRAVWSKSGQIRLNKDQIGAATQYKTLDGRVIPIASQRELQASDSPITLFSGRKAI